jgi:ribosomal protein S18 acetylase RimI-like enzyme
LTWTKLARAIPLSNADAAALKLFFVLRERVSDTAKGPERAKFEDLPSILKLQKLAFLSEAELLGDYSLEPLSQPLKSLQEEFRAGPVWAIWEENGPDPIGSVRAREEAGRVYVAKLIVHPDRRNQGLGQALLTAVEKFFGAYRYQLHTTSQSLKNLYLYRKMGYEEFKREKTSRGLIFVYLEKNLT